MIDKNNTQMLC